MKLLETAQGVVFDVHVKPNAKQFRMELDEDELVVSCCEAPVKGKVNKELLKRFSRLFGRRVDIVSGCTSRQKRFLVNNITVDEAERVLVSALTS
ncbi:MAG: DUF167 domain-containing protein [Candidatus Bathyarchaeota archaeon]|nr:DUF167 domain-containing protein [Candidatus Bathyarchaeum sp.]